jgi:DNA-binding NtrC family response regulator
MTKILIIEESSDWKSVLSKALSGLYELSYWPNCKDVYENLRREKSDAIILDLQIKQEGAFSLLKRLKSIITNSPVIVTSEIEKAELVVKAIKGGAFDFIPKPYSTERIKLAVAQALENRSLKNEIDYLRREQDIIYSFDRTIALSPAMKEVIATLKKFSQTD